METNAFFDDISARIAQRLRAATHEIIAAVAWFTDPELFDALCRQAGQGRRVRLAVLDDPINVAPGRLNFRRLQEIGGEVFMIPGAGGTNAPIMHHKFCVIDRATIIMGSYNWTKRAQDNDENIVVLSDAVELAADYLDAFDALLAKHALGAPVLDTAQVRRRLEIIRSLLLLDEWETLAGQLAKLRPVAATLELKPLFDALDQRESAKACDWISAYLQRATALTLAADHEIPLLRLKLSGLEYQITALTAEKAEVERLIHAFSVRSGHEIGDLITRYLQLRAEQLRRKADSAPDDTETEAEAERARTDYEQYRDTNEETRQAPEPPTLSVEDTQRLKHLYREASQKCHPDKVDGPDRARATELFVQLNAAYKANDLSGVLAIHAAVREGNLFVDRAKTLTASESLGHAIAQLQQELERLQRVIRQLHRSDIYRTFRDLDDWDAYFEQQRVALQLAIQELEKELDNGLTF